MTEKYEELGGQRPDPIRIPDGYIRGCGKPWCNHIDGHFCPWMDGLGAFGKAVPCGCVHKPETPMRKRGK